MANIFPNPDGRNKIVLTEEQWEQVENLCGIMCTGEEIASILKMDYDTLLRNIKDKFNCSFSEYFKSASSKGKASLRRRQFKKAVEDGHPTMLIWLGKQYLGQKDKIEYEGNTNLNIAPIDMSTDEKLEMIEKYKKQIESKKSE